MRNQAFLLAAGAAVVIGCGGGGHHSSTKAATTSTTGTGFAVVLPHPAYGRVEVDYLTGAGRASGDVHLLVNSQSLQNQGGIGLLSSELLDRDLNLSGSATATFQDVPARLNVPFGTTTTGVPNSINYTQLPFQPSSAYLEGDRSIDRTNIILPGNLNPALLPARVRAFPGRTTSVPIRISNQTFAYTSAVVDGVTILNGTFDLSTFQTLNFAAAGSDPDADGGHLLSRLSDFVRFDLSGMALVDRPDLRNGNATGDVLPHGASYVYFSGDNVALSNSASGSGSIFYQIADDPTQVILGGWQNGSTDIGFIGTYDVRDNNPSIINPATPTAIAQYGEFHDYTQVLAGGGSFEVVMFPNSSERYTYEGTASSGVTGRLGDMIAFTRNASNQVTSMYYGGVDLVAGTFTLFPIRALGLPASDTSLPGITGTVSGYTSASGATTDFTALRHFTYTFTSAPPSGFSASGTATVFRI